MFANIFFFRSMCFISPTLIWIFRTDKNIMSHWFHLDADNMRVTLSNPTDKALLLLHDYFSPGTYPLQLVADTNYFPSLSLSHHFHMKYFLSAFFIVWKKNPSKVINNSRLLLIDKSKWPTFLRANVNRKVADVNATSGSAAFATTSDLVCQFKWHMKVNR